MTEADTNLAWRYGDKVPSAELQIITGSLRFRHVIFQGYKVSYLSAVLLLTVHTQ